MGMIERLKGISNWQTVVVICFYIGSVLTITIVAVQYNIVWLIAGGATTLGIVAGSLTGVARQSFSIPTSNTSTKEQEIFEIQKTLASISNDIGDIKTEVAFMKIGITDCEKNER